MDYGEFARIVLCSLFPLPSLSSSLFFLPLPLILLCAHSAFIGINWYWSDSLVQSPLFFLLTSYYCPSLPLPCHYVFSSIPNQSSESRTTTTPPPLPHSSSSRSTSSLFYPYPTGIIAMNYADCLRCPRLPPLMSVSFRTLIFSGFVADSTICWSLFSLRNSRTSLHPLRNSMVVSFFFYVYIFRLELLREREKQKEEQVEALKRSMQSGMAQAMKEQAQLREEMAYQYKLGNFEAAAAIQRRLDPDVPM